jgi:hypothetical protein
MDLVGVKEASEILGWDKRKVSVYLGRGKLPEPIARLAAGPVWYRRDIEAFARGDAVDGKSTLFPQEHLRAILWAHFEAARLGILSPEEYGDPLPWTVDGKPPGRARALRGLSFAIAYKDLWPRFLQALLTRNDLDELIANPRLLWAEGLSIFGKLRDAWELEALERPASEKPETPERPMTLNEASEVLGLLRDREGPLLVDLEDYRDARLAETTDSEEEQRIRQAFYVAMEARVKR